MRLLWPFPAVCALGLLVSMHPSFACTTDVLMVHQEPITVTLCDLGSAQGTDGVATLRIREHLQRGDISLDHQTISTVPDGSTTPQTIEDIDLAKLGLSQHLHISVRLTPKGPRIEHAILLPGPIILR